MSDYNASCPPFADPIVRIQNRQPVLVSTCHEQGTFQTTVPICIAAGLEELIVVKNILNIFEIIEIFGFNLIKLKFGLKTVCPNASVHAPHRTLQ